MLNRTRTDHKIQVDNKKLCLHSMTGSRKSSASLSPSITHTDAILLDTTYNNNLVSQVQKSSASLTAILPLLASTNVALLQENNIKTTVPYFFEKSTILQSWRKPSCSSIKSRAYRNRQTTVNYITNNSIDNRRTSRKQGYPKVIALKMMNHIYYQSALLMTLCTLAITSQYAVADSPLLTSMQRLKISPDIVNIYDDTGVIKVELHGNIVKPGDQVPARHFKDLNMAKITWESDDYSVPHTLFLFDLDRKPGSNSTQNIYNQYTSLNIPGNIINQGQAIVAFDTPTVPCQQSAKHRILMLAFKQHQNIDISDVAYISAPSGHSPKRENFKLKEFIERHRLGLDAANVFLAVGESNGVCSGSVALYSPQSVSLILIAMVMAVTVFGISSRRSLFN